eukprot:s217_g31.t1
MFQWVPQVQAAHFKPYGEDGAEGVEWIPCPIVSAAFPFDDTTCIAVRSLPFAIGRFRLFDPQTMRAGPNTPPIVTVYERVEPGRVEMISKGDPYPRCLTLVLCPSGFFRMSPDWIVRLIDEQPGVSFLGVYARALRLISGLCSLGSVRARRDAMRRQADSDFRMSVLSNPDVRRFMSFLGEFAVDELPVVFEVIRNHLFPDEQVPCLFRAARSDPRTCPSVALRAGSTDLRELELWAGPALPHVDIPAAHFDRPQGSFDVEALMQCTLGLPQGIPPLLPSSLAGVYGPSCFGAELIDPEVPTIEQVHDMRACVHVFYRNKFIKSQVATYTADSTGQQLIERLAPLVSEEVANEGVRSFQGELHLSGKRYALHTKKTLVQVLYPGECVLEVHFGKSEHEYAVTLSAESGRARRSHRHTSHSETGSVKKDKSDRKAWHRHTRPVTPDRQPSEKAPEAPVVPEPETAKRRRHGWDPVGTSVADVGQSQSSGVGPRFTLSFQPPSGFDHKHSPPLMRQLNSIQAKFPSTLREFSVVVLHQDLDPLYFSNVQDFGLVLSRIAISTRLSLLSYGLHWTLQYDDFEVDTSRTQATAFFRTVLQAESGDAPLSGSGPKKDEGRSGKDPSRSRSPPAPSRPPRKVFGASGQSSFSGSGPKSRSTQRAPDGPVCAAFESPSVLSGDFDRKQVVSDAVLCSGVHNSLCSPVVFLDDNKLSEPDFEPWHDPSLQLRDFSVKDSSLTKDGNFLGDFTEHHNRHSACPGTIKIDDVGVTADQALGTWLHAETHLGGNSKIEDNQVDRTSRIIDGADGRMPNDSQWSGRDGLRVMCPLPSTEDGLMSPERSLSPIPGDAYGGSTLSTVLDTDVDQGTDGPPSGDAKTDHPLLSGCHGLSVAVPSVADTISDVEDFGSAIPAAQEFLTHPTASVEEQPAVQCSPTLPWTQLPVDGPPYVADPNWFGHGQEHLTPEALFSAFRDAPVKALGGLAGITLIFLNEKIRLQLQAPDTGSVEGGWGQAIRALLGQDHPILSIEVRTPWWNTLGPLIDVVGLSHTKISEKVRQALSCKSLLPDSLRHAALMEGIVDGKGILSLRVHREETLPTLVASYRRQSDLSPEHLCKKGVMTWLLPSPDHPDGVRFLDMFEGARALGFQHGLCLPADLDSAMMCVGNAVSPAQALLAFASVAQPHLQTSELQSLIEVWLFRQVPLHQLTRQLRNLHWMLVDARIGRPIDVPAWQEWPLLVQAKLFPIPLTATCLAFDKLNFAFLPSARPDGILECARVLNDRALVLCVRLRDFPVLFIDGDIVVQAQWPSLHSLAGAQHLCVRTLSIPFGLPIWS